MKSSASELGLSSHQCISAKKIRNESCVLCEDLLFNITNKQVSVTWAHLDSHCYATYLVVMFTSKLMSAQVLPSELM